MAAGLWRQHELWDGTYTLDDLLDIAELIRERTKRQYDELQNIRNKGGRIINLGTPWHKEDVLSRMPNIERYDCYQTGLISREQLEQLRQSMARPCLRRTMS